MATGERLGLERSKLATDAQEAGDRLRFNYAQLASSAQENAASAAAHAAAQSAAAQLHERDRLDSLTQWQQEHALKTADEQRKMEELTLGKTREERMGKAASALDAYRNASLDLRDTSHQDLQGFRYDKLGQQAGQFDTRENRLQGQSDALNKYRDRAATDREASRFDKFDIVKYQAANHAVRTAAAKLSAALANDDQKAAAAAQAELSAAQQALTQMEAAFPQRDAPSAGAALGPDLPPTPGINAPPAAPGTNAATAGKQWNFVNGVLKPATNTP